MVRRCVRLADTDVRAPTATFLASFRATMARVSAKTLPVRRIKPPIAKADLGRIADPALLKNLWRKSIKPAYAKWRIGAFVMAHPPLDLVAMDWSLEILVDRLCRSITDGTYRPQASHIIRSAKSSGLTRPLSILSPEDQLVYKAILVLAESDLMRGMQDWTRFGRTDRKADDEGDFSSDSGWFRAWITRQGHLWTITEHHKWIVETDIANFFPSIQLPFLLAHIQAYANLSEASVRLLCRILEDVATLPEFRRSATVGLPQENFDCSRVLAHTHLRTVDDEFANEGSKNRFSRYMDDVVIGADSEKEALQFVHRIQRSMERIGLYPNTAKTRITTAAQFRQELMKPENDELGELELEVFSRPAFVRRMTADLLSAHLSLRPRPKAWERVLRRWYSLCRTARDPALLGVALRHLAAFPGSAPHILDYMSVFPLDANRLRNLFERVDSFGGVYENIEILAQEFVCQAAGSNSTRFRARASEIALGRIRAGGSEWVSAAACVTVGKYGQVDHLQELRTMARRGADQSPWKLQALMPLLGSGIVGPDALREWRDRFPQAWEISFLEAAFAGQKRPLNMLADFIAPREALRPKRWVVRPRSVFMIPILASVDAHLWTGRSNAWDVKLKSNPSDLTDRALRRWWSTRIRMA